MKKWARQKEQGEKGEKRKGLKTREAEEHQEHFMFPVCFQILVMELEKGSYYDKKTACQMENGG